MNWMFWKKKKNDKLSHEEFFNRCIKVKKQLQEIKDSNDYKILTKSILVEGSKTLLYVFAIYQRVEVLMIELSELSKKAPGNVDNYKLDKYLGDLFEIHSHILHGLNTATNFIAYENRVIVHSDGLKGLNDVVELKDFRQMVLNRYIEQLNEGKECDGDGKTLNEKC